MNINLDGLDGLDAEIVSMADISSEMNTDTNAVMVDPEQDTMSIDNIPDMVKVTEELLELIQYLDTDEAVSLVKNDQVGMLYSKIDEKFPHVPFSAVKMLTDETESTEQKTENIVELLDLCKNLGEIKQTKGDIKKEFEHFRETKMEKYEYHKHGGKEAFEKKIYENVSNDKTTLNRQERRALKKQNKKLKK